MQSQEFRYGERYEYSFFKDMVRVIGARCGLSKQARHDLLHTARSVTQYELWAAMQEMLEWMEIQGRPFHFSHRAFYFGTSQPIPLFDLVGDLMEISALRTGHHYGLYARDSECFPFLRNEIGTTHAILQGFFARLFDGDSFGVAFSGFEPETPLAVWLDILYGRDHEVVWEGWTTIHKKITFQAMSFLLEDFLLLFSLDQFRRACLFLKKRVAETKARITAEHARLWIAEFYGLEANRRVFVH